MRKLLLLLAAFAMLAVTGAVSAATTTTVTITKAGYVPSAPKINQGDSVQFTNSDTIAHQIVFKTMTGITCAPSPLVLQPGQSGSCTFQTAGSTTFSDPNAKGSTFRGTVTINSSAPAETLTLVSSLHGVVYGGHTTLSGVLSSHKVGENVDVLALGCGTNGAVKVATVQTTTNGAFSVSVQPLLNTSYTVKVRNTTSAAAPVTVRPRLHLSKTAAHRFAPRVSASTTFAGKYTSFQRYTGSHWVYVRTALLRSNTTGVLPSVITTASFTSAIRTGVTVRAVVGQAQVGSCYLPGISNAIRS
jgi:plastocyanin